MKIGHEMIHTFEEMLNCHDEREAFGYHVCALAHRGYATHDMDASIPEGHLILHKHEPYAGYAVGQDINVSPGSLSGTVIHILQLDSEFHSDTSAYEQEPNSFYYFVNLATANT